MSKLTETITEEEFLKILKGTKQIKHKLGFLLGYGQGMRISEVVSLQPENIDFNQRLIRIKQGKGNKDRNIPIMPRAFKVLKKNIRHIPVECSVRNLQYQINNISVKQIGKKINFHMLRHSCATRLLNKEEWNIRQVQQFLGHSNLNTTQIYTHVTPQDLINKAWGE